MFQSLSQDDEAVSPVIGVILMVAITVILAAVIGAFVLDIGSNQQENVNAGVSVDKDSSSGEITIRVQDLGNADYITVRNYGGSGSFSDVSSVGGSASASPGTGNSGEFSIVAVSGDNENVIQTVKYDF